MQRRRHRSKLPPRSSYTSQTVTLPSAVFGANRRSFILFFTFIPTHRWSVNEKHVSSKTQGRDCQGAACKSGAEKPTDCKTISDSCILDELCSSGQDYNVFLLKNEKQPKKHIKTKIPWQIQSNSNLREGTDTGIFPERGYTKGKHFGKDFVLVFAEFIYWIPLCTKKAGIWFIQIQT